MSHARTPIRWMPGSALRHHRGPSFPYSSSSARRHGPADLRARKPSSGAIGTANAANPCFLRGAIRSCVVGLVGAIRHSQDVLRREPLRTVSDGIYPSQRHLNVRERGVEPTSGISITTFPLGILDIVGGGSETSWGRRGAGGTGRCRAWRAGRHGQRKAGRNIFATELLDWTHQTWVL